MNQTINNHPLSYAPPQTNLSIIWRYRDAPSTTHHCTPRGLQVGAAATRGRLTRGAEVCSSSGRREDKSGGSAARGRPGGHRAPGGAGGEARRIDRRRRRHCGVRDSAARRRRGARREKLAGKVWQRSVGLRRGIKAARPRSFQLLPFSTRVQRRFFD